MQQGERGWLIMTWFPEHWPRVNIHVTPSQYIALRELDMRVGGEYFEQEVAEVAACLGLPVEKVRLHVLNLIVDWDIPNVAT